MPKISQLLTGAAMPLALTGFAAAQQFQNQAGAIGGPSFGFFCEGVEVADLDLDGRLDFVGSMGAVFNPGPTPARIPQIQMNKSLGVGSFTFTDEAVTRLPVGFVAQAGGCTAFDIEGDGDADLLFAQMQNRQPQLLRNNGSGVFTNITATNFPVILMTSPCAQYGDVDNDGDLDVAIVHQAARTRLFLNNGAGVFSDVTLTNTPNVNVTQAQDVSLIDIDNDFDLDMLVTARSTITQKLYLNNGSGVFTDNSASLGYTGSGNNYESDWTDLDNDGDLDGFWTSVSGFLEGSSRNNLIPGGTLGFTTTTGTVSGTNGGDDNEVTFIDTNNDNRLDVIIGALGSLEKLYLTNPGFTFTFQAGAFNGSNDPTLDGAPGDFDGDGRMDYVSAVGESGTGNKVFKNTGSVDTNAPLILRQQALGTFQLSNPTTFRMMIQDGAYDDGQDYIKCEFDLTIEANNGTFNGLAIPMKRMGGHLFRGLIDVASTGASTTGALVSAFPRASDRVGNTSNGAGFQYQLPGYLRYGVGAAGNTLNLNGSGNLQVNQNTTWTTTGCDPNAPAAAVWANGRANLPNFAGVGITWLVDPITLGPGVTGTADGSGVFVVNALVPNVPALAGQRFDIQAIAIGGGGTTVQASNGIEATVLP
ncbi:MAG: VCBS repeat-containing protein [Planctomycetes bacterium]|nr:VCBS repeat-containing protein [Planctomycetota bacterium]